MFTSRQPSRPQAPQRPPQNPMFQQQTRDTQTTSPPPQLTSAPRSQIEAMPPLKTLPETPTRLPLYNPATMHPVFFMGNWRKTPFPLPMNPALSPVASGYVFPHQRPNTGTKL